MTRRVMILVTHLLGVGHLTRAALLADGLHQAGMVVTLVSGGRPVPNMSKVGWRFVQLPPVHIVGTDFSNLLDENGEKVTGALKDERRKILLSILQEIHPNILITEHFPFGRRQLATEFLALIDAARMQTPPARIVASIRDVLVAPTRPDKIEQANDRINTLFDLVLVHGDEAVLALDRSWPGTAAIASKLRYTGYMTSSGPDLPAPRSSGEILVSGGGSAAALPLLTCAIRAAHLGTTVSAWRILAGHGISQDDHADLQRQAASGPQTSKIIVERARPDFPSRLADCAVSVSMAGYNTMLDLIRAQCPAVVVPFDQGQETEQARRAEAWADAGLVEVLNSGQLDPEALLAAISRASAKPRGQAPALNLDGIVGSVRSVKNLAINS
jgi:predicted glycosyltransferase